MKNGEEKKLGSCYAFFVFIFLFTVLRKITVDGILLCMTCTIQNYLATSVNKFASVVLVVRVL